MRNLKSKTTTQNALRTFKRSESGSSLVMALVCVAVIGAIAAAAMQLSTQMNAQSQSEMESKTLLTFIQTLETIVASNKACLGAGGTLAGLKFSDGATFDKTYFNPATAADTTVGQEISLGTHLLDPTSGRFVAQTGAAYAPLNLTIDKLSFRKATLVVANQYKGELVLKAHIGTHRFAPRVVGNLLLVFAGASPGSAVSACTYAETGQAACESMSCQYSATATKQKCVCGFPASTACGAGEYITGMDQSTNPPTAICTGFKVDCSDSTKGGIGPGFFLSGFDSNGDPICQPVEGSLAGAAIDGVCGAANGGTYPNTATTTAAGQCSAGTPTAVTGAGPFAWNCNGISGGAPIGCSASKTGGPPDPCLTPGTCYYKNPVYYDVGGSNPTSCASMSGIFLCSTRNQTRFFFCALARYEFTCLP